MSTSADAPTHKPKAADWPGAFPAIRQGFQAIPKYAEFAAIYVLAGIASTAVSKHDPHSLFGVLIGVIISLVLLVAFTKFSLSAARNHDLAFADLFAASAGEYLRVVGVVLLVIGLVFVSVFGLLIPLIWFIPWTAFTVYMVIDRHVTVGESFRQSKQMGEHNKRLVWGVIGASVVYGILCVFITKLPGVGWVLGSVASSLIGLGVGVANAKLYYYLEDRHGKSENTAS